MTIVQSLDSLAGFHHMVRVLHLRELAQAVLNQKPLVKTLPESGAKYRCRYLESFFLKDEFFGREAYQRAIAAGPIGTFADLGCNVGWFAALLRHETGRSDLRGLMIDANPEMIEEAHWSVAANELEDVRVVHGLVGAEKAEALGDFYLLPSNLGSSQFPVYEPGKPPKGDWRKIVVPRLSLESTWTKYFGNERCNLLKVDIEGSEKFLFNTEARFLRRVDRIILEWHKWIVSRSDLDRTLASRGFELVDVLSENTTAGIAWYQSVSAALRTNDEFHTNEEEAYELHA